jgi:hypothetical protein
MVTGTSLIDTTSRIDALPASQAGAAQPQKVQPQTQKEDTVQLSAAATQAAAAQTQAPKETTQPTLDEIIKEAAQGNLYALVRLALV